MINKSEKENVVYFLVVMARNSLRLQLNRCFTVIQERYSRQFFYEKPWIVLFNIANNYF